MSIRNLDAVFHPESVALIGAGTTPATVGSVLVDNLLRDGFAGEVFLVNPRHSEIAGRTVHPDVASLPKAPDLAVIATPPGTVPGLIAELGARGTKGAVVITAGFGEGGRQEGQRLRQAMLDAARPHLLRIVGPNCLGILVPRHRLDASFAGTAPFSGRIAFVTQSGAVVSSVIDWATGRGIGFSYLVSLGDMADVDFGDMLDYLANDMGTRAILLYVEAVTHARKFMSAARAAARSKPVILVKAGRHAEGAKAAASHTGAMTGADEVYDAAIRRAGMLRVYSLDELFDAVETLANIAPPAGDRLAILSNGGGMGVMATDALIEAGGRLAELSAETIVRLDQVLPATWSGANPVDIIGDAPGDRYAGALAALIEDRGSDAILVLNCPTAVASSSEAAQAVVETLADGGRKVPVLTSWVGDGAAAGARQLFADHHIPTYDTPGQAVRAFMHMVTYRENQETLTETPRSLPEAFEPRTGDARAIIRDALGAGRSWLTEPEAKALLAAYDIPVVATNVAATPHEAAGQAASLGGAVALKILSPDISHKTDVGGVALDLQGPSAVEAAAAAMLERVGRDRPEARVEGFTVQPMVRRPGAYELIVGVLDDSQFGPMILFGQGGTAVEVIGDKALALPPLNMHLAREAMGRTRICRLLRGYRNLPPVDLDAVALTLVKVSQLVVELDEVVELDINPLLADSYGVIALDARVKVAPASRPAAERLAIRPYPRALEETILLDDGRELFLRPVVPEDEPSLQAGFAKLTPEEVRLRFFVPMKTLSHVVAARFTQIDYDREMALVLTEPGLPGTTEIFAVVRIAADPDNERAEFAIIVTRELTGRGLGRRLMERIIAYAKAHGIGEIFGDVLRENDRMLGLCDRLGFRRSTEVGEPGIVRVTLDLRPATD